MFLNVPSVVILDNTSYKLCTYIGIYERPIGFEKRILLFLTTHTNTLLGVIARSIKATSASEFDILYSTLLTRFFAHRSRVFELTIAEDVVLWFAY